MSNSSITLHGSIPLEKGGKELLSLTGSATVLEIGGNKILIDLGLFQGGEGADLFNKKNIDFLNNIDVVIISHPHIDHVGRLPLLYKYGFRKNIYMTSVSKDITKLMLEDSFKIQEGDSIERLKKNDKLGFRLRQALKIKQGLIALKKDKFNDKAEKFAIISFIKETLGEKYNYKETLDQLTEYLAFYNIETEQDIKTVIRELKEGLFSEEDMSGVLSLIQPLDYFEEKIISHKQINSKNGNTTNQKLLEDLPKLIVDYKNELKEVQKEDEKGETRKENKQISLNEFLEKKFEGEISVDKKSEKRRLRGIWYDIYREEITKVINSTPDLMDKREKFKKELEEAFYFCYVKYSFLDDKNNINAKDYKNNPEYRGLRKQLKKYKGELAKYDINSKGDIDRLIEDNEKIIDKFKLSIPFSKDDIIIASHILQVNNKSNSLRSVIGITLSDAAHVVGSALINIVSGQVKGKINNLLDINGSATSICLSGDLGRINNNRLGKPELPAYPLDYIQIESTYGGREHRNRQESVKDLIDSIKMSEGHTLISSFSQHRLQEILMTILESKIKDKTLFDDREILVDAPLGEKLTNLYVKYHGEIFNLLDPNTQKEIFGKQVFRFLDINEWKEIYSNESQLLSDDKNEKKPNKNYIILASSGMMEGGAIMNHLGELLEDPDTTILAPGYLAEGTIGHQIVNEKSKTVTINGIKYKVECNSKFIDGFSSHISHSETLSYISECLEKGKFKLDSTISLNHGNIEGQEELKKDIESILVVYDRTDIKVVIPKMFDNYQIEKRKVITRSKDIEKLTVLSGNPKGVTPSFLLNDNLDKEFSAKENKINSEIEEKRNINNGIITKIKEKCSIILGKIRKTKESLLREQLHNSLKPYFGKLFFMNMSDISKLSTWQKETFYGIVDKKLKINIGLKNSISSCKNKIKNINIIYDLIEEFKNNIDELFPEEILKMEEEKIELKQEVEDLILEKEKYTKEYGLSVQKERIIFFDKQIETKIGKIRFLDLKNRDLQCQILGDISIFNEEKLILSQNINTIDDTITGIKSKNQTLNKQDKEEILELENQKINKKKQIRELEKKITKYESKRSNFESRLKNNIPLDFHNGLSEIFLKLWNTNGDDAILKLKELCDKAIFDIQSDIIIKQGDLKPHITIDIQSREPLYDGRDLYSELVNGNNGNLDIDKLKELLGSDILSENDKKYINKQLQEIEKSIYNKKNSKREITIPMKKITKLFKNKQLYNKDLGVNLKFSIKELNKEALEILSNIFEKDYFEDSVYPHFNIYLFLKSKEKLIDYISRKYNLEKLKGVSEAFETLESSKEEIEYAKDDFDNISLLNMQATTKEALNELNYGIDLLVRSTKEKIGKISLVL